MELGFSVRVGRECHSGPVPSWSRELGVRRWEWGQQAFRLWSWTQEVTPASDPLFHPSGPPHLGVGRSPLASKVGGAPGRGGAPSCPAAGPQSICLNYPPRPALRGTALLPASKGLFKTGGAPRLGRGDFTRGLQTGSHPQLRVSPGQVQRKWGRGRTEEKMTPHIHPGCPGCAGLTGLCWSHPGAGDSFFSQAPQCPSLGVPWGWSISPEMPRGWRVPVRGGTRDRPQVGSGPRTEPEGRHCRWSRRGDLGCRLGWPRAPLQASTLSPVSSQALQVPASLPPSLVGAGVGRLGPA